MKMNLIIFLFYTFIPLVINGLTEDDFNVQIVRKFQEKFPPIYLRNAQIWAKIQNVAKQLEGACKNGTQRLMKGVMDVLDCDKKYENETVCTTLKSHLKECSFSIVQVAEECIPVEAKGLPTLILDSVVSILNFSCSLSGEELYELVNPCLMRKIDFSKFDECKEIHENANDPTKIPKKPQDVCRAAVTSQSCLEALAKFSCTNEITRNVFKRFFEAATAPCKQFD